MLQKSCAGNDGNWENVIIGEKITLGFSQRLIDKAVKLFERRCCRLNAFNLRRNLSSRCSEFMAMDYFHSKDLFQPMFRLLQNKRVTNTIIEYMQGQVKLVERPSRKANSYIKICFAHNTISV